MSQADIITADRIPPIRDAALGRIKFAQRHRFRLAGIDQNHRAGGEIGPRPRRRTGRFRPTGR